VARVAARVYTCALRWADLEKTARDYIPSSIPTGPFKDDADRDSALGAALLLVTYRVTGSWPNATGLMAALKALTEEVVA
jgi:hypothetical protein